jgi:uncharacterized membrane protein
MLIAAVCFILVFLAASWFIPRFLRFTESPWSNVIPAITALLTILTSAGTLTYARQRRRAKLSRRQIPG